MENCANCNFVEKSFDGILGENLICLKLNDALGLMGIPHKLDDKFLFYIKSESLYNHVSFKCIFYEKKGECKNVR